MLCGDPPDYSKWQFEEPAPKVTGSTVGLPQVAPLPDIPDPCGLFIAKDCPSCDRILAAIKDDVMAEKIAGHCSDCRKVINAYRAALMERITKENANG